MADQAPAQPLAPPHQLMQFITGHWVAAAIYSAARLKIADQLHSGAKTSEELAAAVGAHGPSVFRLLRALAALGVFKEVAPRKFALTELGDLLREDHPGSMRPMAMFQGAPAHWQGWGSFEYSVRTGKPAFEHVHGKPFFEYCKDDKEFAAAFNGAMTGMSAAGSEAIVEAYDFSGFRKLMDVGGGHGYLITCILRKNANLQGGIFDLPEVVAGAKGPIAAAGLTNRCELIGGSFFDSVPPADACISKHIIHDWDDEHSIKILTNMRRAMTGPGKVLLVEMVITPDNKNSAPMLLDLEMLHSTHGGRERTADEFAALFTAAGLKLNRVIPTKGMASILEASLA